MSDALFYDPAVLRVVRAILLSKGIRAEQDLEDGLGEVVLACIEHVRHSGRPPENVAEALALVRPIARAHGVDEARKRVRRGRSNLGPTGEADERAPEAQPSLDPVDQARMLSAIRAVLEDDEIEALSDVGAGVRQTELAAESDASAAAMRKRVQKSRETARVALNLKGYMWSTGFAALIAGTIAMYLGASRESRVASHAAPLEPRERAAEQRRLAAGACREQHWNECERALDDAAALDAEGDRAREVSALREAITAGRREAGAGDGG